MPPTTPGELANGSVVVHPKDPALGMGLMGDTYGLITALAGAADTMPAWGVNGGTAARDAALTAFWPTEPMFASALYTIVGRYASFGWTLKGPPLTTAAVQRLLHSAQYGEGWMSFCMRVLVDLFTQDNGAFIEIVRAGDSPSAAPIGINHLDSSRCYRTGVPQTPVIYYDDYGKGHRMQWYQIIPMAEFPSPRERHRGMQYCALTRVLKAAQIMREIETMKHEKASGRFTSSVHLVSGMPTRMIEDAMKTHNSGADAQGLTRYITPLIIGTLDPTATIGHAQIDMKTLPDGFNETEALTWYVTNLAMAFGTDYSDFAPSPGRNIGSGSEARTAHVKSRGKGAAVFMTTLQQVFNFRGVMPSTVTFQFGEQDLAEEFDRLAVKEKRASWIDILVARNVITRQVARQMLVDAGDMDPRYLKMMGEEDATGEVELEASLPPAPDKPVKKGEPAPNEDPVKPGPPTVTTRNNDIQEQPQTTATKRPAITA